MATPSSRATNLPGYCAVIVPVVSSVAPVTGC